MSDWGLELRGRDNCEWKCGNVKMWKWAVAKSYHGYAIYKIEYLTIEHAYWSGISGLACTSYVYL